MRRGSQLRGWGEHRLQGRAGPDPSSEHSSDWSLTWMTLGRGEVGALLRDPGPLVGSPPPVLPVSGPEALWKPCLADTCPFYSHFIGQSKSRLRLRSWVGGDG